MNILDIAIAKQLAGGSGGSGTDNYNDLSNLPKINDTTLSGNKSSSALGLQSEINSDSKLASDLVDDTNQDNKFVTSTEKNTWNAKQNAIDADHKINADYVDDSTSTNKFVTASDKETWNAKQNAIDNSHKLSSDLVDDTNHTNKFVTSTEKQTWNAKQNAIDADHKLSSSLVSFTDAEAAALASGIDSSKVGQISTNQTNILYALNRTGKNHLPTTSDQSKTSNRVTFTVNNDGTVSVSTTSEGASASTTFSYTGGYVKNTYAGLIVSGAPVGSTSGFCIYIAYSDDGSSQAGAAARIYEGNPSYTITNEHPYIGIFIVVPQGLISTSAKIFKIMVSEPDMYAKDPTYVPYALPNYDLTRLEAEDRAALAEEIDAGAKNLWANGTSGTISGWRETFQIGQTLKKGTYIIYFDSLTSTDTDADTCQIIALNGTTQVSNYAQCPRGNKVYTILEISADANVMWIYSSNSSGAGDGDTATFTNGMICTKAAFGVSKAFVPYRVPINGVFWAEKYEARSTTLVSTGIKFTASKQTIYRITATAQYGNSKPTQLVIKKKLIPSESEGNFVAVSSDTNSQSLTATGIMTLGVGGYFEVYAAYDGTTSNRVYAIVEEVVL